jgi:hypothetical protein
MSTISLFTVGTGTFSSKWPAKPTFQPSKLVNNAGAHGSRKFLYNALSETRELSGKPNLLLEKEIQAMASYRSVPPVGPI